MSTALTFTVLEETFMHLDDPTHPITVHVEVRVAERLDDERLRKAIHAAIRKHPRARAHLKPWSSDAEKYEWFVDDEPQVERLRAVSVDGRASLDHIRSEFCSQPLTLLESPPFRVLLVHHLDGDVVMLAIHHSASDGIGAVRLLQSIMRAYAEVADDTTSVDLASPRRHKAGTDRSSREAGNGADPQEDLASSSTPVMLAPRGASSLPGYGLHTLSLPLEPILASTLRRRLNATVNDLLLAAAHLSVDSWHREGGEPAERIAIAMPINKRPEAWRYDVVGNYFSTEIVATAAQQRVSPETCLAAVVGVTAAMKNPIEGAAPTMTIRSGPKRVADRRGMIQLVRDAARSLGGTLTLSNVGRIESDWVGASLDVREMWFTPPPVGPSLGIGAASVGPTLYLALRYSRGLLSDAAALEYASMLNQAIDQVTNA